MTATTSKSSKRLTLNRMEWLWMQNRLRNNYDQVFCWVHVQSITIALSLLLSWLAWHSGKNINDAQPVSKIAFQTISLRSLMYFIVRFCIIIKTNKKKIKINKFWVIACVMSTHIKCCRWCKQNSFNRILSWDYVPNESENENKNNKIPSNQPSNKGISMRTAHRECKGNRL